MAEIMNDIRRFCEQILHSDRGDHFDMLGLEFVSAEHGRCAIRMPYRDILVGDPDTGVIHGGAVTGLLDTCCGFAATTVLGDIGMTPTIDLRIDYMRPATPQQAIVAEAEVYRSTEHVIFTRAIAHQGDPATPVASAVGNFFRLPDESFSQLRDAFREGSSPPSFVPSGKGAPR